MHEQLQAWNFWSESKGLELMDPSIANSYVASEVLKCIQIGLLCVQDNAADRPTMSSVVHMLGSDNVSLPSPICPAFSVGRARNTFEGGTSSNASTPVIVNDVNDITLSEMMPR